MNIFQRDCLEEFNSVNPLITRKEFLMLLFPKEQCKTETYYKFKFFCAIEGLEDLNWSTEEAAYFCKKYGITLTVFETKVCLARYGS